MTIYILLLLFMFFCAWFIPAQEQSKRKGLLFAVVMTAALICGLGDMLGGYDRYIYGEIFDYAAIDLRNGVPLMDNIAMTMNDKELGYGLINILIATLTTNRYIFIFLYTIILYLLIFIHLKRYTNYPFLTFFILMCIWYFFTYTYLRQVLAAAIVWFAIPFAVKRKPIPFFAIVVLAATFHNSALLFGLVYFVANKNFTKQQIVYLFIFALLFGLTPVGQFLMTTLGGAVNEEKATLSAESASKGARFDYFLEAAFFVVFMLQAYRNVPTEGLKRCMFNIALTFCFILLFFIRFGDGGRMSWYFLIGTACCSSEMLFDHIKEKQYQLGFLAVMVVLYLRIISLWGVQLSPYKTFLTNGVREGDFIYEQFEYDDNYANDKLYKL